ncbi:histidine phosphotransferase ChpT [Brevundimonas sp.]|uniref:histidine phosphotransferase ChpT n=1 Tax=Brevundimonas sp. TaxID=1871086 RepID=UPI003D6CBAB4
MTFSDLTADLSSDRASDHAPDLAAADLPAGGAELAAFIAGKLCHDFISPAGAIMSGLDLLEDPTAQDMRDDAMGLIRQSARKMVAHVHFARVAFGAATTSEQFTSAELHGLVAGLSEGGRATLDWRINDGTTFSKPQARILINLAWMTLGTLPTGGVATITAGREDDRLLLIGSAEGNRARFKPEALTGLKGQRLTEGLAGQWIQPYWLWLAASEAGGRLDVACDEGRVGLIASTPA